MVYLLSLADGSSRHPVLFHRIGHPQLDIVQSSDGGGQPDSANLSLSLKKTLEGARKKNIKSN
jgi:hypothetical protein